ncbi:MAG TPA: DUF262 domain-containing HNH endonuclease family protein [Pyrinomonadaceae bacterium]
MASTLEIKAESKKIGAILKDSFLRVPTNQRNYAWEGKHVRELFADLKGAISEGAEEYFLGSIVLMGEADGANYVADGQQRLATTLILIAAIRDHHVKLGDKENARKLQSSYLLTEEYGEVDRVQHLRLNDRDNEYFFQRIILVKGDTGRDEEFATKPKIRSHKLIDTAAKEAAKTIRDIVKGLRENKQHDELAKWIKFIREKTVVVRVRVPDEGAAYTIFETMNDRGLALSAVDLIKNYLFGKATTNFETVKHNWTTMIGALDTAKEDDVTSNFVRHYWISRNGTVRGPQLFNAIKKRIVSPAKVTELSVGLSQASQKYIALLSPSDPYWAAFGIYTHEIRKNLEVLKLFGVKQIRPLLLSVVDAFGHKDIANVTHLAVAWTVRLIVSKMQGSGELETLFGDAAHQTREKKLKSVARIAKVINKAVPNDGDFQREFEANDVKQGDIARYYLRAFERQQQNDPQAAHIPSDEAVITLEHLMPKDFAEFRGEWKHITDEMHEDFVWRLGNQMLLGEADNRAIGSRGYPFKKPILENSGFHFTAQASGYVSWGPEEIKDRQKQLAKLAPKVWPLTLRHKK